MADSVVKLRIDSKEYDANIKRAGQALTDYFNKVKAGGGTLTQLDEGVLDAVKAMGELGTKADNSKSALRELTQATIDMTAAYRQLTDEEKNSPLGQAMQQSIQQMTDRAGQLRDAMDDVNASIKNTASDTRMFDQIAGAATLATSSFQTLQGATKLLGIDLGDNVEILAKLQAAMAVTNGLTAIQTQLQGQSAVMLGIKAVQTKAAAAAEALATKNTIAATAAQRVFNAVAKMNPYILLATAAVTAVGAIAAFTSKTKDAKVQTDNFASSAQRVADAEKAAYEKVGGSIGSLLGKYSKLQVQWNALRSDKERNQFLKDNVSAFNSLGWAVKSAADAERILVENTEAVVMSLRARAEAEAYGELYAEAIKKKAINNANETVENGRAVQGVIPSEQMLKMGKNFTDQFTQEEIEYATRKTGTPADLAAYVRGEEQRWTKAIMEYRRKRAKALREKDDEEIKKYQEMYDQSIRDWQEKESNLKTLGIQPSENNSQNVNKKAEKVSAAAPLGSAKAYSEELQDLKRQQDMVTDPKQWLFLQNEINRVTAESKLLKGEWTDGLKVTFDLEESTGELEDMLNEINGAELDPKTLTVTANTLDAYNAVQDLVKDIEGTTVSFNVAVQDMSVATSTNVGNRITNLSKQQGTTAYGSEEFNAISAQLADATAYRNIIEKAIKEGIDTAQFDTQELWKKVLSPDGISDSEWQAIIDKLNEEIKKLNPDAIELSLDVKTGELKEVKKTAEDTKNSWKGAVTAMQQVSGALEQIEDPAAKVAGIVMQAIANIALAFSKSSIQAAGGGPFAWIAATAAGLGTMISTIAAIKSATKGYAEGGIIKGNGQFSGDNIPIMANEGEIVLTRAQQGNLVSQMQNNTPAAYDSLPYVNAEQIVLGVNNYFKRLGRGEIVTTKRQ